MSYRKHTFGLVAIAGLMLAALACTCGPLAGLSGASATLQSAATEINQNMPTAMAELTNMAPTFEAAGTSLAPTVQAAETAAFATAIPSGGGTPVSEWATSATATSEYTPSDWSAQQATGAPDTATCGDNPTAWATGSSTGVDNITLTYATPVIPSQINIYETYNPGAIVKVDVVDGSGTATTVYTAQEQVVSDCPRTLNITVTGVSAPVSQVVVYLDQTNHDGWDEIDAVELVGTTP